jgi:hypothetical protein
MTAKLFKPVDRGPQVGSPPSLEFVPVGELQVDPAYQRLTDGYRSRQLIVGMVKEWDWRLALPLLVARRVDGAKFIIDGQHRHAGALERGDIAHLPCVVLPAAAIADEARTFVAINDKRQALSQADKFAAMLVAGDEDAQATAALIEATGWRIVRGSLSPTNRAGALTCAPRLVRLRQQFGEDVLRLALLTLREAWPDTPVVPIARLTEALCVLFRTRAGARARLVEVLGRARPEAWMARGHRIRSQSPGMSEVAAIAASIREACAPPTTGLKPAGGGNPPLARPAPAPTPVPAEVFGEDGKTWCDQCERRVTAGAVQACSSRFCTVRKLGRHEAVAA